MNKKLAEENSTEFLMEKLYEKITITSGVEENMWKNTDEIITEIRAEMEEKISQWQQREVHLNNMITASTDLPFPLIEVKNNLQKLILLYDEIIEYFDRTQNVLGVGGDTADKIRKEKLKVQEKIEKLS